VAFGALGTPVITLATVTGLPLDKLSAMVGRQLPFFSVIVPFWLIWAMAGFAGMVEVWPPAWWRDLLRRSRSSSSATTWGRRWWTSSPRQ
jgi:L-lactate permease